MTAPLIDGVRSWSGHSRLGWVATMVDVATSDPALASCRPDWTATQDLSIYATGWMRGEVAGVDAALMRVGKRTIVVSADIYDVSSVSDIELLQTAIDNGIDGRRLQPIARGLLTFARIPGAAASGDGIEDYNPANWVGDVRRGQLPVAMPGRLNDWIGLQVVDAEAGVVEVAPNAYVTNSIGTINGGVQAMMVEAAAEVMRPGLVATDVQIHYLAQLSKGPARTTGRVYRDAKDHSVVQIEVLDAGAGDRLLTTATVTLQVPPERRPNVTAD